MTKADIVNEIAKTTGLEKLPFRKLWNALWIT
jgi:hypothetical protein